MVSFFQNSEIIGLELDANKVLIPNSGTNYEIYFCNAYNEQIVDKLNCKFDIIIDDGPHDFESQLFCLKSYQKILNKGGVLIIEDISSPIILNRLHEEEKEKTKIYDLRSVNNRFDDLVLIYFND